MELLDSLFKKRFCLPSDANMELYETGIEKIPKCLCGEFNHVCCVFRGKKKRLEKVEYFVHWV
jgi:hypothetical protein